MSAGCKYFCDLEVLCEVPPAIREYLSRCSVPQLPCYSSSVASSLPRVFAGSNEKDRSCEGDVDEEVVVELDDSPGATNGTKFWVLQKN